MSSRAWLVVLISFLGVASLIPGARRGALIPSHPLDHGLMSHLSARIEVDARQGSRIPTQSQVCSEILSREQWGEASSACPLGMENMSIEARMKHLVGCLRKEIQTSRIVTVRLPGVDGGRVRVDVVPEDRSDQAIREIEAGVRAGGTDVVRIVVALIASEPCPPVKSILALALGIAPSPAARCQLLEQLRTARDPHELEAAAYALVVGPRVPTAESLLSLLQITRGYGRALAHGRLISLLAQPVAAMDIDTETRVALAERLSSDRSGLVRHSILALVGDPSGAPELQDALRTVVSESEPELKEKALLCLWQAQDLTEGDARIVLSGAVLSRLGHARSEVAVRAIAYQYRLELDTERRADLLHALPQEWRTSECEALLLAALRDPEATVRVQALKELANPRMALSEPLFCRTIESLGDVAPTVRVSASEALAAHSGLEHLRPDPPEMRKQAMCGQEAENAAQRMLGRLFSE